MHPRTPIAHRTAACSFMVGNLSGMTHDWWYIPIFAGCQDNLLVNVAEPSALLITKNAKAVPTWSRLEQSLWGDGKNAFFSATFSLSMARNPLGIDT